MKPNGVALLALATLLPAASCAKNEAADEPADNPIVHGFSDDELALECALGFEQLKADALAIDGMELMTETAEQAAYMSGGISFTVTKDTHYAHPTILRRDIVPAEEEGVSVNMAACGYGDKKGFDKVVERFDLMNQQFEFQQNVNVTIADSDGSTDDSVINVRPEIGPSAGQDADSIEIELEPADDGADVESSGEQSEDE